MFIQDIQAAKWVKDYHLLIQSKYIVNFWWIGSFTDDDIGLKKDIGWIVETVETILRKILGMT